MKEIDNYLLRVDKRILFTDKTLEGRFLLDNGSEKLKRYFSNIEIRRYEDALQIDNINDLIDYILSSTGISNVNEYLIGDKLNEFKNILENECGIKGYIHISKESGMFIGKNGKGSITN